MKNLSEEEVKAIDLTLFNEIEEHVDQEIINWQEMCECEEEGDAMEYVLASCSGGPYPEWRANEDGTIDVIMHGDLNIEWDDEEGNGRSSWIPNNLRGRVSDSFVEDCSNSIPSNLEVRVKTLFQ